VDGITPHQAGQLTLVKSTNSGDGGPALYRRCHVGVLSPSREVVIPQRDVKELETFVMNLDVEQWVVPGEELEGSTLTTVMPFPIHIHATHCCSNQVNEVKSVPT